MIRPIRRIVTKGKPVDIHNMKENFDLKIRGIISGIIPPPNFCADREHKVNFVICVTSEKYMGFVFSESLI